jgi:UDP:flavonoid glycosyltransferase YjiC (YdhE family)
MNPVVLFYAINGAGLGHLVRCLSVARRLVGLTPVFITTCRRAHVLDVFGIRYHYVPSLSDLEGAGLLADRETYQRLLGRSIASVCDAYRPAAVVADGMAADPGLLDALGRFPGIVRVAIRRAYRRDGREHLIAARDRSFDLLVLPHDEGSEDVPIPAGPRAAWVGPLVVESRDEALPRDEARRSLGLPPEGICVLFQLGAGAIGEGKSLEGMLASMVTERGACAVVASYDPVAGGEDGAATIVHRFPLARYLNAFDLAVAAAGYNTFTELMHHGVPAVFVPNARTISDDQVGRARRAERAGAALMAPEDDPEAARGVVLRALEDAELRRSLTRNATNLMPENGAARAAALIEDACRAAIAAAMSQSDRATEG